MRNRRNVKTNHEPREPNQFTHPGYCPSRHGFGFAVLEGAEKLVDWGVKRVSGDKNAQSLHKVAELIAYYLPAKLVVEDCSAKTCRTSSRIRTLIQAILKLAKERNLPVRSLSRKNLKKTFSLDGSATKHEVAELVAKHFPEELGLLVPPEAPTMDERGRTDGYF